MAQKTISIAANYTILLTGDETLFNCDTSGGQIALTGPTPPPGTQVPNGFRVKIRARGGNPVVFSPAAGLGQTVEGGSSLTVSAGSVVELQYDQGNANWFLATERP